MEKLRLTIGRHGKWSYLSEYIDRIEGHIESDFSHSLENAKALLESIGKEICKIKSVELRPSVSINGVIKQACSAIGYGADVFETQISGSLANIGQQMGDLRNKIGAVSHGRTAQEMRERNDSVDMLTREFLIDSTIVVAIFLIRAFEDRQAIAMPPIAEELAEDPLNYTDAADFNDSWDDTFGEFEMGEYSFTASEILFNVDFKAYNAEYAVFSERNQEQE